jgi:hypothetical protein
MIYSDNVVWEVWSKGEIFAGNDPVFWRKDVCGAWIFRGDFENQNSEYGWVIGYIKPLDKNRHDSFSNLYPIHVGNTSRDKDKHIICKITAAGIHNIMNKESDSKNLNPQISNY